MGELHASREIASQPSCWRQAVAQAANSADLLPRPGERVAVVGCGTSWFMGMAYAALRERDGSLTDAFAASEFPVARAHTGAYDRILAITRSGTTTEVIELLGALRGKVAATVLTGVPDAPVAELADTLALEYADERSVVQTRFATSVLALLRASLGEDLDAAIADADLALAAPLNGLVRAQQFSFLGAGWTVGLAHEAALKMREAAQLWTEAYPAMEYRHGPISIAEPGRVTWMFGPPPSGLTDDVAATGADFVESTLDPMAHLIVAQRLAVAIAEHKALNPDQPRHLTRSVILD